MIFQLVAEFLGVAALTLYYAGVQGSAVLVSLALVAFVAIDVYGLVAGRLGCGPGVLLPVVPALFVRPWLVGFLWGFVVLTCVDLFVVFKRRRSRRWMYD